MAKMTIKLKSQLRAYYKYIYLNLMCTEGIDFIGPNPSVLTFTSGQSTGDVQCADMTILDNSFLEGERNFSVELRQVHSETNVKFNKTMTSVDIDIDDDNDDCKFVPSNDFCIIILPSVPH